MKIIIKILLIFILVCISSFCPAKNQEIDLQKELDKLEEISSQGKLNIDEELEQIQQIEKSIEQAAKIKRNEYLKNGKSLTTGKAAPTEEKELKETGEDYEEFLQKLKEDEKIIKKERTKQKGLTKQLQSEKINVSIEINKYFSDEKLIPIDLQDCLYLAMQNNFDIKILSARRDQGKWNYYNTYAAFLPNGELEFEINRLHGDFLVGNVVPINANESPIWSLLKFNWTLLDGGARIFRVKSEKSRYYADIKNLDFQKQLVLKDTSISYYNLLGIKLGIEILTRNLKETQAQLKLTTQNFEAGIGTKFDVLRAKAEVAQAQQRLIDSYNSFRLEQANLANILGISVFSSILPVEEDVKKKKLMDKDLSVIDIAKISEQARSDINAIKHSIKALVNDKKRIFSGFRPKINTFWTLGQVGTTEDSMGPSNAFGINTTFPFGTNFGADEYTRIKRVDAQIKEGYLTLKNKIREIQQDIIRSFQTTKAAEERIEAAKEEVVAADESLNLAFLRLEAGLGIYVDVLQSQTAKTDAKINLIRAIIDHNIAQVNLLFDSGTISSENILKDYDKYLSKKYVPPEQETQEGEIKLPQNTPTNSLREDIKTK